MEGDLLFEVLIQSDLQTLENLKLVSVELKAQIEEQERIEFFWSRFAENLTGEDLIPLVKMLIEKEFLQALEVAMSNPIAIENYDKLVKEMVELNLDQEIFNVIADNNNAAKWAFSFTGSMYLLNLASQYNRDDTNILKLFFRSPLILTFSSEKIISLLGRLIRNYKGTRYRDYWNIQELIGLLISAPNFQFTKQNRDNLLLLDKKGIIVSWKTDPRFK